MVKRHKKYFLLIGCICFTTAIWAARITPISGYRLSIYRDTPMLFWCSFGLIGILCIYSYIFKKDILIGNVLSIIFVLLTAGLPLLQGYHYFGRFDALNHLGQVQQVLKAGLEMDLILYPGIHILAAIVSMILNYSPNHSLLLITIIFTAIYWSGMVLLARYFTENKLQYGLVMLLTMTFLPIMSIRTPKLQPIPTVLTMFVLPLAVFIAFRTKNKSLLGYKLIFILLGLSLVIFHPQHSLGFIGFITILGLLTIFEKKMDFKSSIVKSYNSIYVILFLVILSFWLSSKLGFSGAIVTIIISLGTKATSASAIGNNSSVLQSVGGSIALIFARVFLLKTVISITTLIFVMKGVKDIFVEDTTKDNELIMLYIGFIPALCIGIVYFVMGTIGQFFRFAGVLLVFGAIATAIQIGRYQTYITNKGRIKDRTVCVLLSAIILISIFSSIGVVYKSPILYQPSEQITQSEFSGYEWVFHYRREGSSGIASIDTSVYRMRNAIYGKQTSEQALRNNPDILAPLSHDRGGSRFPAFVPYHFSSNEFSTNNSESAYIMSTKYAKKQHLQLYDGLRFTKRDYSQLESQSQIYSNGEASIFAYKAHS